MRTVGQWGARARVALTAALAVAAVSSAAVPTAAHARVLGTNGMRSSGIIANTGATGVKHCQAEERLPRGTRAIRLSLHGLEDHGPAIAVIARDGHGHAVALGGRPAGWTEAFVTVPLRHAVRRTTIVTLCMTAAPGPAISIHGQPGGLTPDEPSGPHVRADYLDGRAEAPPGGGWLAGTWGAPIALATGALLLVASAFVP